MMQYVWNYFKVINTKPKALRIYESLQEDFFSDVAICSKIFQVNFENLH